MKWVAVVEQWTRYLKFKCSNPATAGSGKAQLKENKTEFGMKNPFFLLVIVINYEQSGFMYQ